MVHQFVFCVALGLIGVLYLLAFESFILMPGFRRGGATWIYNFRDNYLWYFLVPFTFLWPGAEEAGARGIPLLLISNRWWLALVLVLINIGFMAGHRDRDLIGNRAWLLRFATGLIILIPAVAFHNLIGCYILHVLWNLYVVVRHKGHFWHDRIIIYSAQKEVIFNKDAKPAVGYRKMFPRLQTFRYNA